MKSRCRNIIYSKPTGALVFARIAKSQGDFYTSDLLDDESSETKEGQTMVVNMHEEVTKNVRRRT